MIITSVRRPFSYVLVRERELPPDQQSKFMIQPLTFDEAAQIQDALGKTDGKGFGTFKKMCLELGIKGWENVKDADGKDVPFNLDTKLKKELFARMSVEDQIELSNAVWEGATINDADAKN